MSSLTPASVDQWNEIIDAIRGQILKQIPYMPAMKPEEQEKFIETCRSLQCLERDVQTQEAEVTQRLEKAKLTFQD